METAAMLERLSAATNLPRPADLPNADLPICRSGYQTRLNQPQP
ncbi:MAG: hypothetical protein ACO2PK_00135 [Armatimonadota bacterium]